MKTAVAQQGITLKEFVTEAIRNQLRRPAVGKAPAWRRAFGGLRDLHAENKRIERIMEREFERIEEEDWR